MPILSNVLRVIFEALKSGGEVSAFSRLFKSGPRLSESLLEAARRLSGGESTRLLRTTQLMVAELESGMGFPTTKTEDLMLLARYIRRNVWQDPVPTEVWRRLYGDEESLKVLGAAAFGHHPALPFRYPALIAQLPEQARLGKDLRLIAYLGEAVEGEAGELLPLLAEEPLTEPVLREIGARVMNALSRRPYASPREIADIAGNAYRDILSEGLAGFAPSLGENRVKVLRDLLRTPGTRNAFDRVFRDYATVLAVMEGKTPQQVMQEVAQEAMTWTSAVRAHLLEGRPLPAGRIAPAEVPGGVVPFPKDVPFARAGGIGGYRLTPRGLIPGGVSETLEVETQIRANDLAALRILQAKLSDKLPAEYFQFPLAPFYHKEMRELPRVLELRGGFDYLTLNDYYRIQLGDMHVVVDEGDLRRIAEELKQRTSQEAESAVKKASRGGIPILTEERQVEIVPEAEALERLRRRASPTVARQEKWAAEEGAEEAARRATIGTALGLIRRRRTEVEREAGQEAKKAIERVMVAVGNRLEEALKGDSRLAEIENLSQKIYRAFEYPTRRGSRIMPALKKRVTALLKQGKEEEEIVDTIYKELLERLVG